MMIRKITLMIFMMPVLIFGQMDELYDFSTVNGTLGWVKANSTSFTINAVGDGEGDLNFSTSKTPFIRSGNGLGLSTTTNGILEVRMKIASGLDVKAGNVMNFETNSNTGSLSSSTSFDITDDNQYHIYYLTIPDNPGTDAGSSAADVIDQLGVKVVLNSAQTASDHAYFDYIKIRKTGTTYDGIVQNASFGDFPGDLDAWSTAFTGTADGTAEYSANGDETDSAGKIIITAAADLTTNKFSLWNSHAEPLADIANTAMLHTTFAVRKNGAGTVKIMPRWRLKRTSNDTYKYVTGSAITLTDSYATVSPSKALSTTSETYNEIRFGFFIEGAVGEEVFIDNITTSIDGVTLLDESNLSENAHALRVFPNPVKDQLNIDTDQTISEVQIVNSMGKLISNTQGNVTQIGMGSLPRGIYIVRITFEDGQTNIQKIIKQ